MGAGLTHQLRDILELVMEIPAPSNSLNGVFLDQIYQHHFINIVRVLQHPTGHLLGKFQAVKLLTFAVAKHAYRSKYFFLKNNVLQKVMRLLTHRGDLMLAVIHLLRSCIGTKDEQYIRHIVQHRLLDGVMQLFLRNGARYNMLNSAVIELCEYIRKENLKALVRFVCVNYGDKLKDIRYVDTFRLLNLRYLQMIDFERDKRLGRVNFSRAPTGNGVIQQHYLGALRRPWVQDKVETSYFESEDDDDTSINDITSKQQQQQVPFVDDKKFIERATMLSVSKKVDFKSRIRRHSLSLKRKKPSSNTLSFGLSRRPRSNSAPLLRLVNYSDDDSDDESADVSTSSDSNYDSKANNNNNNNKHN